MEPNTQSIPATEKYEFNKYRNQFFAVFSASIISFSHGCIIGWVTPALLVLTTDATPLQSGPITLDEMSWIGSVNSVGAIAGSFTFGCFTSFVGCKRAMAFLGVPGIAYWLTIMFGSSATWIIFARFFAGWTGGGIAATTVLYVAEIADPKVRGRLGAVSPLCMNSGTLTAYIFGALLQYNQLPFVFIIIPIVFMINFICLPNTPQHLIRKKKFEKAERSLTFYKGCTDKTAAESAAIYQELERLKTVVNQQKEDKTSSFNDILEWRTLKAMLTAIVLNCLRMFPGCFVFITYAGRTLGQTGVEVDPYKIAIMFGVIEMVASLTAIRLADKFNRKTFMITGLSIAASGHWAIATCSYLREVGYDVSSFDWMSIVCMSIIIFIAALCSPVTTVTSVEVLPAKARAFGITMNTVSINILSFTMRKSYPILSEIYGISGYLTFLSLLCIFGAIFVAFAVEETKGRQLDTVDNRPVNPAV